MYVLGSGVEDTHCPELSQAEPERQVPQEPPQPSEPQVLPAQEGVQAEDEGQARLSEALTVLFVSVIFITIVGSGLYRRAEDDILFLITVPVVKLLLPVVAVILMG